MVGEDALVGLRHLTHLLDAEIGFHLHIILLLKGVDLVIEHVAFDTFGHAPALQEAAVGVPDGPCLVGIGGDGFHLLVVEAHVEEGVHRARHRDGRTRADGDQQRRLGVAELASADALQFLDVLAYHAVDLGAQLGDGIDGLVAAEGLGGDDEAWRHRHAVEVEVLQVVGLVADEDLVVHLGRPLPERADQHLGVVGHDVANELLVEGGLHIAQRREDAADEVVQRLHEECVGEQVAVELLRFLADHSGRLAFVEFPFGVEELRDDDLQRVFIRLEEVLDDDAAHVFGDELEDVDILAEGEASRGQRVAQHVEFLVEALVGDAVELKAVTEVFEYPIDLVQRAFRDIIEVDALHHLLHELGGHALKAEGQAHGFEFVLTVGAIHRRDADGDMAFVVDVLPSFALFGVEDDGLEFVHESVDHGQRLAEVLGFVYLLELVDLLIGDEGETAQRAEDVDRLEAIFLAEVSIKVADVHEAGALALVEVLLQFDAAGCRADEAFVVLAREHQYVLGVEA